MLTIRTTAKAGGKIPFDVRMANQKNLRHAASGSKQCKSASESEAPAFAAARYAPPPKSTAPGGIRLNGGGAGPLSPPLPQYFGRPPARPTPSALTPSQTKQPLPRPP